MGGITRRITLPKGTWDSHVHYIDEVGIAALLSVQSV